MPGALKKNGCLFIYLFISLYPFGNTLFEGLCIRLDMTLS